MLKIITLSLAFVYLLPWCAEAQSNFKEGYIIDNTGLVIQAEIQERNWYNNPVKLTYRPEGTSLEREADIADLREFGFTDNGQRFVRAAVEIEVTPDETARLNSRSTPEFRRDTVWLRQFVAGEADLFYWSGQGLRRYFYRLGDGPIDPLISRSYRVGLRDVRHDRQFRTALAVGMVCEGGEMPDALQVDYEKKSLIDYFLAYHDCRGESQVLLTARKGPSPRFAVRMGAEIRAAKFARLEQNGSASTVADFGTSLSPTFGVEIEQDLEFTNRRWSVFMGVNYRRLSTQHAVGGFEYFLDEQAVAGTLGLRLRAISLGRNDLYVMGGLVAEIPLQKRGLTVRQRSYRTGLNYGGTLGAGLRLGDHLEVEGSYRFRQDMLTNYLNEALFETGMALTVAYRL